MKAVTNHVPGASRPASGCPPHDWRCPVVMKLDPEHVAWTCAGCGAIATTDSRAVRPE